LSAKTWSMWIFTPPATHRSASGSKWAGPCFTASTPIDRPVSAHASGLHVDGPGVSGRSAWAGELLATTRQKGPGLPAEGLLGAANGRRCAPAGGEVIGGGIVGVADQARIGTAPGLSAL